MNQNEKNEFLEPTITKIILIDFELCYNPIFFYNVLAIIIKKGLNVVTQPFINHQQLSMSSLHL